MKSLLDPKSNRGLFSGPLSAHVGAYLAQLESQGYKRPTLYPDALLLADLDAWMKRDGRLVKDLSQPLLDRFLVHHMRKRRSRRRPKRLALQRLLMMLRTAGAVEPESPPPGTPAGNLVRGFAQYLKRDRGYADTTVTGYCLTAQRLLDHVYGSRPMSVGTLNATEVLQFIRYHVEKYGRSSSQYAVTGLKSFLRFLRHRDEIAVDLAAVVPSVAGWALSALPRHLPKGMVDRVLADQEHTSPAGRRDYAILLILARLGLRSCEVAALRLEDLNWEASRINVRSRKAGRTVALPLSADVGRAIAEYLKVGRPRCACREVFVRNQAPVHGLSRIGIGHVARQAFLRSGVTGISLGAHTFRHTLASDLLRRGASLDEIGRILRHKDASTTAIYAKVDMGALRPLAIRWPGGAA
jgi:site-specific recombinase XerD